MMLYKQKKTNGGKAAAGKRLLVSITVLGSAGPIRFVINEEELVATVIQTALKSYAREGRLPVLGSDLNDFVLYCPIAGPEALSPWQTVGSVGVRNFMLCKKPPSMKAAKAADEDKHPIPPRKTSGSWKAWFNKSLNLKTESSSCPPLPLPDPPFST